MKPEVIQGANEKVKSKVSRPSKQLGAGHEPIEKSSVETKAEMYERLKEGFLVTSGPSSSEVIEGKEPERNKATLSEEEIQRLLEEVAEIKNLLFCRLLLTQASLLPAALRANSIQEFLEDRSISTTDLRDLCLKMEKPSMQDVRDACADLVRADEPDDDTQEAESSETLSVGPKPLFPPKYGPNDIPDVWVSERERQLNKREASQEELEEDDIDTRVERTMKTEQGVYVDFGRTDDESQFQVKKIRIKICGRSIWNYPSEKALKRGGWLQFSVLAKNSTFADGIQLCRSWDEFFELGILAMYGYFPNPGWWLSSLRDRAQSQLLQLVRSLL